MAILGQKLSDLTFVYTKVRDFGAVFMGRRTLPLQIWGIKKGADWSVPLLFADASLRPYSFTIILRTTLW